MKRFAFLVGLLAILFAAALGPAGADILWYNGDFDGVNALANEINTVVSDARVYDDFNITGSGWIIDTLWSNNLTDLSGVTEAYWEIRSGVSAGNGGVLVAGGFNSAVTQSLTGRSGFGYNESRFEVGGLNIALGPGAYWLTIAPVGFGGGRSFVSTTSGLNAVGDPAGNNGNSFFDSAFFGANFQPSANYTSPGADDFSMGVAGRVSNENPVPEPSSMLALMSGLPLAGYLLRRRRS